MFALRLGKLGLRKEGRDGWSGFGLRLGFLGREGGKGREGRKRGRWRGRRRWSMGKGGRVEKGGKGMGERGREDEREGVTNMCVYDWPESARAVDSLSTKAE